MQAADDIFSGQNWDGMARQVALNLRLDVSQALPLIRARTLAIGCGHDHMVAPAHARSLASSIAGARYAELPTGHLAPMERPDLLAGRVRAFLEEESQR